jgi:hypothetical protein
MKIRIAEATAAIPSICRVTSLARANVGELVVSDVILDDCVFAGAHGLDKLRIGAQCSFRRASRGSTRRRIISEEIRWRQIRNNAVDDTDDSHEMKMPALEVAGIYRDLRKSLEDAKNEPGAADFYYGEMEMRRLSGHKHGMTDEQAKQGSISLFERVLLDGYWALSGYGLRASRALMSLAVIVFIASSLYTSTAFAVVPPQPTQVSKVVPETGDVIHSPAPPPKSAKFSTALDFSARESISLLQVRGNPELLTRGPGTVLDIALRLAGPTLLAFTVLALRARIKR